MRFSQAHNLRPQPSFQPTKQQPHVSEWATVEGVIAKIFTSKSGSTFLNIGGRHYSFNAVTTECGKVGAVLLDAGGAFQFFIRLIQRVEELRKCLEGEREAFETRSGKLRVAASRRWNGPDGFLREWRSSESFAFGSRYPKPSNSSLGYSCPLLLRERREH